VKEPHYEKEKKEKEERTTTDQETKTSQLSEAKKIFTLVRR
jgi:hypothetical protein